MKKIVIQQSLALTVALVISFFMTGCDQDVYNVKLKEIEQLKIKSNIDNFAVVISIKGYVACPVTMHILGDGNRQSSPKFLLKGKVDTTYRGDWYEDELTFELDKAPDCLINDVNVRVKMLD